MAKVKESYKGNKEDDLKRIWVTIDKAIQDIKSRLSALETAKDGIKALLNK